MFHTMVQINIIKIRWFKRANFVVIRAVALV